MADLSTGLFYVLTHSTPVSTLVGTRVYPTSMPQNPEAYPLVVYQLIGGVGIKEHGNPTSLPRQRVQMECWSEDYDVCKQLDETIRQAIDGFRGTWDVAPNQIKVLACQSETEPRDDKNPVTGLFLRSRDYFIRWSL